jgi:hypothetical protein
MGVNIVATLTLTVSAQTSPKPTASRARICKRLRSPGIDSEESIPQTYLVWQAGTKGLSYRTARLGIDSSAL